jgi:hypothetical protein
MRILLAALLLSVGALATACDETPTSEGLGPADQRYTVHGRVTALRDDEIAVAHEAIPSFVGQTGETVGMEAMTMTFRRAPSLSTEGIAVGDPVELTFEVRWRGDQRLTASAIRELPADTVLELAE